jgi:tetratricopeptide (TPR) repeat protein
VLERPLPAAAVPPADAVRKAVAQARAGRPVLAPSPTIESTPGELRQALASLRAVATPAGHLRVGLAYQRAGVLDQAFEHFDAALKQNSRLAAAYDGRARIWRDWGLPGLGIGDATRAVFFAPHSASARNTLGTLLAGMPTAREHVPRTRGHWLSTQPRPTRAAISSDSESEWREAWNGADGRGVKSAPLPRGERPAADTGVQHAC